MKSNIKRLLMVLLVCIMASSFTACSGCNKEVAADNITEPEGTTAVQKMLVTVTDNEGNEKQVEGVAVIDEKGNATITVQDEAGKDIVITGKTTKDENGNATIGDIKVADNTNVTVSVKPDTKDEETSTQAPTETPTEVPTETPTSEPTETPTEAPTEAPTPEPTEAPTETPTPEPTETPTEAPTGRTYGYYTDCTDSGLIENKIDYGKHLPYEYFKDDSPEVFYIVYEDDVNACVRTGRGGGILTSLIPSIQSFSDYVKSLGGNGIVGIRLWNFGNYNGRRVCVISSFTN